MQVFHVFIGLGLFGLTVYSLICSLRQAVIPDDTWKLLTVFTGLFLAAVLFTGFIQLGSRHSVHNFIIYKLVATATGGTLALVALAGRLRDVLPEVIQDGCSSSQSSCSGLAFIWESSCSGRFNS